MGVIAPGQFGSGKLGDCWERVRKGNFKSDAHECSVSCTGISDLLIAGSVSLPVPLHPKWAASLTLTLGFVLPNHRH